MNPALQMAMTRGVAATAGADPFFSSVKLLMHMDGTHGAQTFTDTTGLNSITVSGGAATSTTTKKVGSAAMALNGSTDYLTLAASANFQFAGDFTMECWVNFNTTTGSQDVMSNYTANNASDWILILEGGELKWYQSAGSIAANAGTVTAGLWYHVACVRSGTTCTFYSNGVASGSTRTVSGTMGTSAKAVRIGCRGAGSSSFLNGYVDDVRITNGIARYTANFTPPTAAFPDA